MCCTRYTPLTFDSDAAGTDKPFEVDSYIPVRFIDFEWYLRGRVNSSRNSSDLDTTSQDIGFTQSEFRNSFSSRSLFEVTSAPRFRYETVPRFLDVSGSTSCGANRSSQRSESNRSALDRGSWRDSDLSSHSYSVRQSLRLDAGNYLVADLFLSLFTKYSFQYYESDADEASDSSSSVVREDTASYTETTRRIGSSSLRPLHRSHLLDLESLVGYGRVYQGNYAATAMFMIEELRRRRILAAVPSYDQMLALTELIYQNRLKHAVDRRIRRIDALNEIIAYLYSQNLIAEQTPYTQLLIEDIWDYYPREDRSFGYYVRFGFGVHADYRVSELLTLSDKSEIQTLQYPDPGVPVDTILNTSDNKRSHSYEKRSTTEPYLILRGELLHPAGLRWQFNVTGSLKWSFDHDKAPREEHSFNRIVNKWDISLAGDAAYILNTRTTASFSAQYSYERFDNKLFNRPSVTAPFRLDRVDRSNSWQLRLSTRLVYRITIPTNLAIGVSYRARHNRDDALSLNRSLDQSFYFSASIEHYLW